MSDDRLPLWRVHYRGTVSGLRGAEFIRAKSAWDARRLFQAVRPLCVVTKVGSKPVLPAKECTNETRLCPDE